MKRFELWRQDKGSFLYDIQQDNTVDEVNLKSAVSSTVRKLASTFKKTIRSLSKLGYGRSKKGRMSVNLSDNLFESPSITKLAGTQVECLSCLYLQEELDGFGYDARLRLEGTEITPDKMLKYADEIQGRIAVSSAKQGSSKISKAYNVRKNFAKATALRLSQTIKKDIESFPNMYTVYIDSAGYSGEGSTKADFHINYEFTKIGKKELAKNLKGYAISHKYNQENSMGTQINSVYGAIYSLSTGKSVTEAGKTKVRAFAKKEIEKKFGAKGVEMMARLHTLHGKKGEREASDATVKEFQQLQSKFYNWLKDIVEDNHLNLLKFIGIEEGVDHFMAAFVKGGKRGAAKEYKTFSSIDSPKYQELVRKCYDEEFRHNTKCVARVTDDKKGLLEIDLLHRGEVFYSTHIKAQLNNSNKSKNVVGGIKAADMEDSEIEHQFKKFADEVPNGLEAFMPPDKPKASASGKLKKMDNSKPVPVMKKLTANDAKDIWVRAAKKKWKESGNDPDLSDRIKKRATPAIQYIMAGLTGKEAIEHALGE